MRRPVRTPQPRVDLDELLEGPPVTDMSLVADAIAFGHDERWLIAIINRYLLTPEQARILVERRDSVQSVLNGWTRHNYQPFFDAWNAKLGQKMFGS